MTNPTTTPAFSVVRRLIAAREAYDQAASAHDFEGVQSELDAALLAFEQYECRDLADWRTYAEALWYHIGLEQRDHAEFGEDYVGPLAEFHPIAQAVQREFLRLMPPTV